METSRLRWILSDAPGADARSGPATWITTEGRPGPVRMPNEQVLARGLGDGEPPDEGFLRDDSGAANVSICSMSATPGSS